MTPTDRTKLLKFLRLLSSDQDGERATAASMANKLAERLGGWDKIVSAPDQPDQSRPEINVSDVMEKMRKAQEANNQSSQAYYNQFNQGMRFHQGSHGFDWYDEAIKTANTSDLEAAYRAMRAAEQRIKDGKG